MTLPSFVHVCEVGPREGMQIEKGPIDTDSKVELVDMLSICNIPQIEVTSFVSPQWVPQMVDAEQVVQRMHRNPSTRYTAAYLNAKGLQRAIATGKLDIEGWMLCSASETFAMKNTNKTFTQMDEEAARQVDLLVNHGMSVDLIVVMAAFGCNYQGAVSASDVIAAVERTLRIADEKGQRPTDIMLADSMGWVTPAMTERLVGAVRDRWPDKRIRLHLHDTRGLALVSAMAAMRMGVDHFESSVGGLGGCPFGNYKGASGNMVTEDFVHLCHEAGVATGIDLDGLIEASRFAEQIVGHSLPGKVLHGGSLPAYRSARRA